MNLDRCTDAIRNTLPTQLGSPDHGVPVRFRFPIGYTTIQYVDRGYPSDLGNYGCYSIFISVSLRIPYYGIRSRDEQNVPGTGTEFTDPGTFSVPVLSVPDGTELIPIYHAFLLCMQKLTGKALKNFGGPLTRESPSY
ncbi:hypothetical protein Hanom_Chr13g01219751 [Helianthus anomalus]